MTLVVERERPGGELLRWRWLTVRLPRGLLAASATRDGQPALGELNLLHRSIAPLGKTAHLHLHLNAAVDFEDLWANLAAGHGGWWRKLSDAPANITSGQWLTWLIHAFLARRAIAACVRRGVDIDTLIGITTPDMRLDVRRALVSLAAGAPAELDRTARESLGRIVFARINPPDRVYERSDILRNDPIDDGTRWPEGTMLAQALSRAGSHPHGELARVLIQYLRVKCMLHAHLVHDPLEPGLDAFDRTFGRLWKYREGLGEAVLLDRAVDEPDLELAAVEARLTPQSPQRIRAQVQRMRTSPFIHDLELGLVYHLIRAGARGPLTDRAGFRSHFGWLRSQAGALETALTTDPRLLAMIRGLDVAGRERDGPLWLALPVIRRLRRLGVKLGARVGMPSLRLTLHVGEDFGHLASGLRAIAEPFDWKLIERGDRLGHARALGIDARRWSGSHPSVVVQRWERMLDLAWLLHTIGTPGQAVEPIGAEVLVRIRDELCRHLEAVGLDDARERDVVRLYGTTLGSEPRVIEIIDQGLPRPQGADVAMLARYIDGDPRLREPIEVTTASDLDWLEPMQDRLLARVLNWHTTIEINPSSNLLIGESERVLDQPAFRIHPLDKGPRRPPPVSISADDPLTFATSLGDEFAYAWAAIVLEGGEDPNRARSWLQEAATASYRARFTETGLGARRRMP